MDAVEIAQIVTSGATLLAFGAAVWQVRSAKQMAIASIAQARARESDPQRFREWEVMLVDLDAR